jgi:iron(III) transport system substrate-binding protein
MSLLVPELSGCGRDGQPRAEIRRLTKKKAIAASFPLLMVAVSLSAGCLTRSESQLVVYAALDQEFSEPILDTISQQHNLTVRAAYDVEATKTVGLVNRILAERERPRCDVFWNNEILHTLRLAREGLLEPYAPPSASAYPANYRAADATWTGLAARARVLLVNTNLVPSADRPQSVRDLADSRWKGQVGLARPLFGTTATHAAVLFSRWGNETAEAFFQSLKENAVILPGNKQVAQAVADGQLAFGLTDTDDAVIELKQGRPVAIVFPDQGVDQEGTLFIPNTIAIVRGGPHPAEARRLVDFLLTREVEERLARGRSAQFPIHSASSLRPEIPGLPDDVRWMDVDFPAAADHWESSSKFLHALFATDGG